MSDLATGQFWCVVAPYEDREVVLFSYAANTKSECEAKVLLASHNESDKRELKPILKDLGWRIVEFSCSEIPF